MRQILITVAGRNSAGKSLIAKKVAEALGLNVVKSYATRKPRPEELEKGLENCDHIFVSDEEYDKLENITAETEINGARYCTTQEILDNSDIYVIDPKGIKDLKERCGSRYKILQFYIYADADKRAARFVARGETKAKFEAREQSEDEQFCDYENNHGWDIIIYNNWDIDTAVKTMLGYVRPIMTPVIEARQKQTEEEFEKMMNPPAEEKVEPEPADEQAGMKEQQEEEPKAEDEQTEDVPADEMPDKEAGNKDCQANAEGEQVEDAKEQTEEPEEEKSETEESPAEEQQAESEMPAEDGGKLEECQQEDASDDNHEVSDSTKPNDDPFSLDFDDEDEDFMNIPAGVDAESDESDGADVDNDEDSTDENKSDAADPFSLDDFDDTDKEDTDSSDEPKKPEEREEPDEEPDNVPEEESEPVEEHVDKSTSEPADENPDNASEIYEEPEESSDDEEDDDGGEAILID